MPDYEYGKRVGYDITGKGEFDTQIDITFDFSDLSVKTREAKQNLSDLSYDIYKTLSGVDRNNKQYGFISPKSVSKKQIESVISKTISLPTDSQIASDIRTFAKGVSALGKDVMKAYANRVDTGLMRNSIYGTTKSSKTKITSSIGWTRDWYKYFGFQENGTRTIKPMRSVLRTYLDIMPDVRADIASYMREFVSGKRGAK